MNGGLFWFIAFLLIWIFSDLADKDRDDWPNDK